MSNHKEKSGDPLTEWYMETEKREQRTLTLLILAGALLVSTSYGFLSDRSPPAAPNQDSGPCRPQHSEMVRPTQCLQKFQK
jgi:hypothetical protein